MLFWSDSRYSLSSKHVKLPSKAHVLDAHAAERTISTGTNRRGGTEADKTSHSASFLRHAHLFMGFFREKPRYLLFDVLILCLCFGILPFLKMFQPSSVFFSYFAF